MLTPSPCISRCNGDCTRKKISDRQMESQGITSMTIGFCGLLRHQDSNSKLKTIKRVINLLTRDQMGFCSCEDKILERPFYFQ